MIPSPRTATYLAVALAALVAAVVLFGAMRAPRNGYTRDPRIGCALVLTQSGHECR